MGKLTAKMVTQISEPGRYGDGNGLYLVVSPAGTKAGTKSWIQRVQIGGKRTDRGLGGVAKVSLGQARKIATANLAAIQNGKNPFEAGHVPAPVKETPAIPTFKKAAEAVAALNLDEWSEGVGKRWLSRLLGGKKGAGHCKAIADLPINEFTYNDIAELLNPLRAENHETARKVRQALTMVFDWAKVKGYRVDNPADSSLNSILRKVKHTPEHRPSLHYSEVAGALRKVRFGYALRVTALAFEFMVMTAARTSEVRFMTWEEVDLDARVWEIPAERMKASRSHKVPLSIQALTLLRSVRFLPNPDADSLYPTEVTSGYIFRMPTGKILSENAFLNRARKDNLGCVPHGFRSSFRDWARECYGGTWEAIELSLAHAVGTSVSQAYFRTDLIGERAPMMQAWSDYLDPLPF